MFPLEPAPRTGVFDLGSKLIIPVSRVAAKIAGRAGERRRAHRQYGRAFRRTRRRFSPQPEGTRAFWPLALLLVAHDRIDHFAPRASPAAKMRKRRGHGDNEF